MQRRFTYLIFMSAVAVMLGVFAGPVHADGPLGSTTDSEKRGCQGESYGSIPYGDTWDLKRAGKRRPGIGHGLIRVGPSFNPEKVRVCALTVHGSKTLGKSLPTRVLIGFEDKGGGNRVWKFWDKDRRKEYSEGRAGTPGKDRCAVIRVEIVKDGKRFSRTISQFDVPDEYVCN